MEDQTFFEEVQKISISLNKKVMNELKRSLHNHDITPFQYHILLIVNKYEYIGMTKIAEEMVVKPSAVTTVINRLCDMDYVQRYDAKEDRRKVLIQLTEKGAKVIKAANQLVQLTVKDMFSCYKKEDQEQFIELCRKLDANI